jgi:hypothetical protein
VESKNLLSQAYVKQSVGKNKAEALKLQLSNFHGIKVEAHGVRLEASNVEALCASADLLVDAFDNAASRELLSVFARRTSKALVHAAISADGSFGMVRWDAGFVADSEDEAGQATCEGGEHLPMIAQVAAALGRAVEDFVAGRGTHDWMVSRSGVARMG